MHKKNKFWHNQYTIPILVAFLIPSFVWGVTTIGENVDTYGDYRINGTIVMTASSTTENLYIGFDAGNVASTTANYNVMVGPVTGGALTTSDFSTGIGWRAMSRVTSGMYNNAVGSMSLQNTTTGGHNVGMGLYAIRKNITGSYNVGIGNYALQGTTDQSYSNNVGIGHAAGGTSYGSNNIFIGYQAGNNLTTASNNIIIGYDIDAPTATTDGQLSIGNLIFGSGLDGTGTTISSGNIGIGTTTPFARLSVAQNVGEAGFVVASSTAQNFIVDDRGYVGIGNLTGSYIATFQEKLTVLANSGETAGLFVTEGSGNGGVVEYDEAGNYLFVGGRAGGTNSAAGIYLPRGGKVGINTSAPESVLQVTGGGLCVGSDANCNSDNNTEGTVYAATTAMTTYDLAENYPTKDHTLKSGDVVALDTTQEGPFVKRAEQGDVIIGAISAEPGALLGGFNGAQYAHEKQVPVALSGRIDINVSTENGNIKSGDYLELSSTPGVATKATGNGKVIGIALESFSGEGVGEVLVFVELNSAEEKVASQQQEIDALKVQVANLQKSLQSILNQ